MKEVNLFRLETGNQGTFGKLIYEDFSCHTLELPWRDNQRNISCIPSGDYKCVIKISPKFGKVYLLTGVPQRNNVLIHSGNYAGDVSLGYKTNVQGCILLGTVRGALQSQLAVLNSRIAVRRFMDRMNNNEFLLKVQENYRSN